VPPRPPAPPGPPRSGRCEKRGRTRRECAAGNGRRGPRGSAVGRAEAGWSGSACLVSRAENKAETGVGGEETRRGARVTRRVFGARDGVAALQLRQVDETGALAGEQGWQDADAWANELRRNGGWGDLWARDTRQSRE
jgi:hypothetical protein